MATVITLMD